MKLIIWGRKDTNHKVDSKRNKLQTEFTSFSPSFSSSPSPSSSLSSPLPSTLFLPLSLFLCLCCSSLDLMLSSWLSLGHPNYHLPYFKSISLKVNWFGTWLISAKPHHNKTPWLVFAWITGLQPNQDGTSEKAIWTYNKKQDFSSLCFSPSTTTFQL